MQYMSLQLQLTEGLQYSVCLKDLLLHPSCNTVSDCTQVLQDELGSLGLPSPTLPADDAGLVLHLVLQVSQGCLSGGKHVGRHICHLPTTVLGNCVLQRRRNATLLHDLWSHKLKVFSVKVDFNRELCCCPMFNTVEADLLIDIQLMVGVYCHQDCTSVSLQKRR